MDRILSALQSWIIPLSTVEFEIHDAIAAIFRRECIDFRQEVTFGRDRLDFLCDGGIAIEVKVGGGLSALLDQVYRYSLQDDVTGIIVVTSKRSLLFETKELSGKPVRCHWICGNL